jgi:tetratricopeptide (TPR) repeat protein
MSNSANRNWSRNPWAAAAILSVIAALPLSVAGFAMGGAGEESSSPSPTPSPAPSPKPQKGCPSGFKFDKDKKQCVKVACAAGEVWSTNASGCSAITAASVTDEELRNEGILLAKNGRYAEALDLLKLVREQDDPRVLGYIGYASRKLGRVEEGIGYYLEALKRDPNYHTLREYLGEGYLQQGKLDLARQQLTELEQRCGKDCVEYRTLVAAIDAGPRPDRWGD